MEVSAASDGPDAVCKSGDGAAARIPLVALLAAPVCAKFAVCGRGAAIALETTYSREADAPP